MPKAPSTVCAIKPTPTANQKYSDSIKLNKKVIICSDGTEVLGLKKKYKDKT